MTYGDILSHLNMSGSEESGDDFETMAKVIVNFIYKELLIESNRLMEEREGTLTLSSSKSTYGMPIYFKEVSAFLDTDNDREIELLTKEEYDRRFVGLTESDDPEYACAYGHFGVQSAPNSAGTLTVESSDATDTGSNYQVVITGLSSSIPVRETITVTGTTAVTTSNSYDASNMGVQRVVLTNSNNAEFTGNIIVKDSDGNTLATIPPFYEKSPTFSWYLFYPTPGSTSTLTVRGLARKQPLTHTTDWPEIDENFHDLLVYGSEEILLPHVGKMRMGIAAGNKYQERKKAFLGQSENNAGIRRRFSVATNPFIGNPSMKYRRLSIESS